MRALLLLGFLLPALAACSGQAERSAALRAEAAAQGFAGEVLEAGRFDLQTFVRVPTHPVATLRVYVEGDGFAWVTRSRPSDDPTPRDALALRLATLDRGGATAYVGRPCQYTGGRRARNCDERYWTSHRLAEPVAASLDAALDQLKSRTGARQLELVGYSGGGGLAVLVAARRQDVAALYTIAGNLDIVAFTRLHGVSPMDGSLNPADFAASTATIPQWHGVGEDDRTAPPAIARAYAARMPTNRCTTIQIVPGADHHSGWEPAWRDRLAAEAACLKNRPGSGVGAH